MSAHCPVGNTSSSGTPRVTWANLLLEADSREYISSMPFAILVCLFPFHFPCLSYRGPSLEIVLLEWKWFLWLWSMWLLVTHSPLLVSTSHVRRSPLSALAKTQQTALSPWKGGLTPQEPLIVPSNSTLSHSKGIPGFSIRLPGPPQITCFPCVLAWFYTLLVCFFSHLGE